MKTLEKTKKKQIVFLQVLECIIELVIQSAFIKNADPLSLIISAPVGSGKTELLKQYRNCRGVKFLSEVTAYGIKSRYLDDIATGKIRILMIGDLLNPLSKQKKTKDDFIACMNNISEEGIGAISTYALQRDGKKFVKCGIITTIAKPDFMRKSHRWYEMGFLSRAIPLTYGYSASTKVKIYEHIAKADDIRNNSLKDLWLPKIPINVKQDKELNVKIIELALGLEKWEAVYGFRRQEQFQTLMMANALKNGRTKVTEEDYQKILELSKFINLSYKEI